MTIAAAAAVVILAFGGGRSSGPLGATQLGTTDRIIPWPDNASHASTASMSPDGRYISYIDMKTLELHVRDLRANRAWQLTRLHAEEGSLDESAISRDGRSIAFASEEKDETHTGLRVLPLSATPATVPRLVLEAGTWVAPWQWSADDTQVLVTIRRESRRTDIGMVTVSDRSLRVLATIEFPGPGDRLGLSPDGRFVGYDVQAEPMRRQRDLYLLPVAGGPPALLLDGPSSDEFVGFAPDGRSIVVRSDRGGSRGVGLWALPVAAGRKAGDPALLRPDFRGDILNMTAAGALFYEHTLRTDELLVTSVNVETGARLEAPRYGAHDRDALSRRPRWSADGQSIMYETMRPTGPVLSVRTITTGVVREIPLNLGYVWTFDWSPDGRSFVCRCADLQARTGLFIVDTVTGDVRPFALWQENVVRQFVPQFSADGKSVTYIRGDTRGGGALAERDIASGVEREVMSPRWASGGGGTALRRSPDGQFLLRVVSDAQSSSLQVYDLRTNQSREVLKVNRLGGFTTEDGAQWLPDSRAFIVNARGATENERELWWVPVDGRSPHKIDVGVTNLVDSAIAIHPDGKQIGFVAGQPVPSKTAVLNTEFRLLDRFLPAR